MCGFIQHGSPRVRRIPFFGTTMSPKGHHGRPVIKKYFHGVQSHAQYCDHGLGVHESAIYCSNSGDSSPKWSWRPCPRRVTMVDMPLEKTCLGVQPHARLRDHGSGVHESAIIARIQDPSPKWSGRPCPRRVTMVRHATDWIVDLITLIHHGHMTCVWSVGTGPPRHRLDRGLIGTCPPRHRLDRGLIINRKLQRTIKIDCSCQPGLCRSLRVGDI